jgi:hypothetical protein
MVFDSQYLFYHDGIRTVRPFRVAIYIEQMPASKPTIKHKLAASALYPVHVRR